MNGCPSCEGPALTITIPHGGDEEVVTIQKVLELVKRLPPGAGQRVLTYVANRLMDAEEGGPG